MPIYLLSPSTILVVEVTIKLKDMINNKKIEESANHYAEENSMSIEDQIGDVYDGIEELSNAYKAGAHLVIEQLLNL